MRESKKDINFREEKFIKKDEFTWEHPGGKLLRKGAQFCTDAELLAILIGRIPKKPAVKITEKLLIGYIKDSKGLAIQPFKIIYQIEWLKQ